MQRQYTGTAGRIENTQAGVFLALTTSRGRALIDRRLYLPEHSWSAAPERRNAAGIHETVQFATKPRLAEEMITAAIDAGITASWVTGDEAYGQDPQLRAALEDRRAITQRTGAAGRHRFRRFVRQHESREVPGSLWLEPVAVRAAL